VLCVYRPARAQRRLRGVWGDGRGRRFHPRRSRIWHQTDAAGRGNSITVESPFSEWMHDWANPKAGELVKEVYSRYCYMIGLMQTAGGIILSPRHEPKKHPGAPQLHLGSQTGQDKERHNEEEHHHPMDHPYPHAAHHPQAKPARTPRHDAHTHPHGDELPDHTNPPSTIRPSKKMTKTGKS